MSQQLQIWGPPRHNAPSVRKDADGKLVKQPALTSINFWTQDGVQFFTLIDSSATVELLDENGKKFTFAVTDFQENDIVVVTSVTLGNLVPAGTPWSQPADKIKKQVAKSGVTKSARQRINFSGLLSVTPGEPPIGLSTL